MSTPDRVWQDTLRLPLSVRDSYMLQSMGRFDPTMRSGPAHFWRAMHTPTGPVTVRVLAPEPERAEVSMWGPGSDSVDVLGILGQHDNSEGFHPQGNLRMIAAAHPYLRLPQMPDAMRIMAMVILQQRVAWKQAVRSWGLLVKQHGQVAPGPQDAEPLRLPPEPKAWFKIPLLDYAEAGVERGRAETIRRVSRSFRSFTEMMKLPPEEAEAKLRRFRGVGPWTASSVVAMSLGWPDAVILEDIELPHTVCWVLAKEARGSDARMVELLEPYRGQRYRALSLAHLSGVKRPRFEPRKGYGPAPGRGRRR